MSLELIDASYLPPIPRGFVPQRRLNQANGEVNIRFVGEKLRGLFLLSCAEPSQSALTLLHYRARCKMSRADFIGEMEQIRKKQPLVQSAMSFGRFYSLLAMQPHCEEGRYEHTGSSNVCLYRGATGDLVPIVARMIACSSWTLSCNPTSGREEKDGCIFPIESSEGLEFEIGDRFYLTKEIDA